MFARAQARGPVHGRAWVCGCDTALKQCTDPGRVTAGAAQELWHTLIGRWIASAWVRLTVRERTSMIIAKEGWREISLSTLVLGLCAAAAVAFLHYWAAALPFVIVWGWVLWFFRDPERRRVYEPGDICSAAARRDGTGRRSAFSVARLWVVPSNNGGCAASLVVRGSGRNQHRAACPAFPQLSGGLCSGWRARIQ